VVRLTVAALMLAAGLAFDAALSLAMLLAIAPAPIIEQLESSAADLHGVPQVECEKCGATFDIPGTTRVILD
jgi:hypothetical protein